jgi:hypothetical protein
VAKGRIKLVFLNIVCTKIISIVDAESVLRNILGLEANFIKKLLQDQKLVSVVGKFPINGAWIMIIPMIVFAAGCVNRVILD